MRAAVAVAVACIICFNCLVIVMCASAMLIMMMMMMMVMGNDINERTFASHLQRVVCM